MAEKMIIKILPDGRVVAETQGVKGPKCEEYVKRLEEVIGGKIVKSERKPEYFEESEQIVEKDEQKIELDK